MTIETLDPDSQQYLHELTQHQKGNLPIFVHPFYNLLNRTNASHAPSHRVAQKNLHKVLAKGEHGETTTYLRSLSTPLFSRKLYPQIADELDASHQSYNDRLLRFFSQTTLGFICLFESTTNIPITEKVIRDTGFQGEILTIPTKPTEPVPDNGMSFHDIAQAFLTLEPSRFIVGGQHSWLITPSMADSSYPLLLDPTDAPASVHIHGCVGIVCMELFRELTDIYESQGNEIIPLIQLSSLVWPQRHFDDVSNNSISPFVTTK